MNKLGKREYVQIVADILVKEYGETLKEYGTDVQLAESVIKGLKKYLFFHPVDISGRDYRKWKQDRRDGCEVFLEKIPYKFLSSRRAAYLVKDGTDQIIGYIDHRERLWYSHEGVGELHFLGAFPSKRAAINAVKKAMS